MTHLLSCNLVSQSGSKSIPYISKSGYHAWSTLPSGSQSAEWAVGAAANNESASARWRPLAVRLGCLDTETPIGDNDSYFADQALHLHPATMVFSRNWMLNKPIYARVLRTARCSF